LIDRGEVRTRPFDEMIYSVGRYRVFPENKHAAQAELWTKIVEID
jgi:hypothetical protein